MDEENSLDRSEVGLFFLMIIILGLAAFSAGYYLGVRKGEKKQAEIYHEISQKSFEANRNSKLYEEDLDQLAKDKSKSMEDLFDKEDESSRNQVNTNEVKNKNEEYPFEIINKDNDVFKNKWCVLVGSFERLDEAKDFSAGFVVRGYDPLIREVELEGVGILYKVSLGNFETKDLAQSFLNEERSLFDGSEYPIEKIE